MCWEVNIKALVTAVAWSFGWLQLRFQVFIGIVDRAVVVASAPCRRASHVKTSQERRECGALHANAEVLDICTCTNPPLSCIIPQVSHKHPFFLSKPQFLSEKHGWLALWMANRLTEQLS